MKEVKAWKLTDGSIGKQKLKDLTRAEYHKLFRITTKSEFKNL